MSRREEPLSETGGGEGARAEPGAGPRKDDPAIAPELVLLWHALFGEWNAVLQSPATWTPRISAAAGKAFDELVRSVADLSQAAPGPCDFSIEFKHLGVIDGHVDVAEDAAGAHVALRPRSRVTREFLVAQRERLQRQASERAGMTLRLSVQ